ncbi:MAG TPA: 2OG-Fe(II) oxygenase [Burkholderiales bacterium]|jgi:SM-20-related protein|nr:2OG-Fe(II) oxygenase [Burkholderiales bacterium]
MAGQDGAVAEAIAAEGWAVVPNFIESELVSELRAECRRFVAKGALRAAAIGSGTRRQTRSEIRTDEIRWLEEADATAAQRHCLAQFDLLRLALNRELQLGLFEFECHFSRYAPGAFYRKHLDQFRGDRRRRLSCVLYLNENWAREDAGELRLHLDAGETGKFEDVLPGGGTLVLFLSERFAHEVLPGKRERLSLAGWFRTRG